MDDDLRRRVVVPRFKGTPEKKPTSAKRRAGNDSKHVANVRKLPSCISGGRPCEAHHLIGGPAAKERGVAMKATDRWCVPLTHDEHMALHRRGSKQEKVFFAEHGLADCYRLAEKLWDARSSPARMLRVIETGGD